jgi:hypothetical protein
MTRSPQGCQFATGSVSKSATYWLCDSRPRHTAQHAWHFPDSDIRLTDEILDVDGFWCASLWSPGKIATRELDFGCRQLAGG